MSCYSRHLGDILAETGIEVTLDNRKEVDRALHEIVGVACKDCLGAWKSLKSKMANEADRAAVVKKLREAMSK